MSRVRQGVVSGRLAPPQLPSCEQLTMPTFVKNFNSGTHASTDVVLTIS